MQSEIKISALAKGAVQIDIEGTIGVSENQQFADPKTKVATYEKMRERIDSIAQIKAKEVIVNIRSTGGNVRDAILIFEALTALPARITTRCYGYTASAATIIAQAASDGCREISENALYLIHNSVITAEGNANEIGATIDLLDKTDQRIASIYALRSGNTADSYVQIMSRNNGNGQWLSPTEAIEAGLADRLIETKPSQTPKNQIKEEMQISERFRTILQVLGITNSTQVPKIETEQIETLEAELNSRADRIELLENKVGEMEIIAERLRAEATMTLPKEDPAITEAKRSPNEEAYLQDARNFK